jgi:hypothetical protein
VRHGERSRQRDHASAIVFLLSDASAALTGQTLQANAGELMV